MSSKKKKGELSTIKVINNPTHISMNNNKFTFIALDLSSMVTGYAVFEGKNIKPDIIKDLKLVYYGKEKIKKSGEVIDGKILIKIYDFLEGLYQKYNPWYLYVEDIYMGINVKTLIGLAKIQAVSILSWERYNPDTFIGFVPPVTWKKSIGINVRKPPYKGATQKQKKNLVINAINYRFGLQLTNGDEDIADAIGVGVYAINQLIRKQES